MLLDTLQDLFCKLWSGLHLMILEDFSYQKTIQALFYRIRSTACFVGHDSGCIPRDAIRPNPATNLIQELYRWKFVTGIASDIGEILIVVVTLPVLGSGRYILSLVIRIMWSTLINITLRVATSLMMIKAIIVIVRFPIISMFFVFLRLLPVIVHAIVQRRQAGVTVTRIGRVQDRVLRLVAGVTLLVIPVG